MISPIHKYARRDDAQGLLDELSCGALAYRARETFGDTARERDAVWCFRRFGKSITALPNGKFIEIGGEHEDYYDPDFCIYNDVVVHHGGGKFDIYGYPKEIFPPTDFHTATLLGDFIYVIGNLGYREGIEIDRTPVYRLNIHSLEFERVETTGRQPGWIHRHRAVCRNNEIRITGGKISAKHDNEEILQENPDEFILDMRTMNWRKTASA